MITGIHHAGIVVADLDRSIDFYVSQLEFVLLSEPSELASGHELDALLRLHGCSVRGALVGCGEAALELLEFRSPPRSTDATIAASALGSQHVALRVDDVRAVRAALHARGVGFVGEVNQIDEGPFAGLRTTFFLDPDDVRIELVESAYRDDDSRAAAIAHYWTARTTARDAGEFP